MSGAGEQGGGVSTVELFFDIVFVFTITQLARAVADDPTLRGVARAMLIFGNLWWMYGGYAWLTNVVRPTADRLRLLLLVGMAGFLVCAISIPDAFGAGGVLLGIGYIVVTLVHDGMLLGPMEGSILKAMGRLGPANLLTAALILAAGFIHGWPQWVLWTAAFVLHWVTPYVTKPDVVSLRSGHFVERHGLVVLIALGESIAAIGLGVQTDSLPTGLVITSILALVVAAALWWLYFDFDDSASERALGDAEGEDRSWIALHVYGYTFLVLIGGIIVFAAGIHRAIVSYSAPVSTATAALISGGVSAYLVGLAVIRLRLHIGSPWVRLILAVIAIPTLLVGAHVSPLGQLATLGAILVAGIVVGRQLDRSRI
jgi:low temperature requirement protein LtrA